MDTILDFRKPRMVNCVVEACFNSRRDIIQEREEYQELINECHRHIMKNFDVREFYKFKVASNKKLSEFDKQLAFVDEIEEAAFSTLYTDTLDEYYMHLLICLDFLLDVKYCMRVLQK